jgi:hypothetical protein
MTTYKTKSDSVAQAIGKRRVTAREACIMGKVITPGREKFFAERAFTGDFTNEDFYDAAIRTCTFSGRFDGATFATCDGSYSVFTEATFSAETDFSFGRFDGAKFHGVNFNGARVAGAIFCSADVRGADFTGCDMTGCIFTQAGWTDWDAEIDGMIVEGANMRGATMPEGWQDRVVGTPAQMPDERPARSRNTRSH